MYVPRHAFRAEADWAFWAIALRRKKHVEVGGSIGRQVGDSGRPRRHAEVSVLTSHYGKSPVSSFAQDNPHIK